MLKLRSRSKDKIKVRRRQFTCEEDNLLVLYSEQCSKDWVEVARKIGKGLTEKQCRDRYLGFSNPSLNHQPFSAEEDKMILSLKKEYGTKWKKIASVMNTNRSNIMIRNRYYTLKRKYGLGREEETDNDVKSQNVDCKGEEVVEDISFDPFEIFGELQVLF